MAHEALQKAKSLLAKNENVEKVKSLFLRETKTAEEAQPSFTASTSLNDSPVDVAISHKSKLKMCIEILCALVSNGPMKLTQLLDKFEIDKPRLTAHLRLLWDRGLIEEEQFDDEEPYYLVTPRGKTVLNVVSPILKEAHKLQMREYNYLSSTLEGAGFR